MINEDKPTIGTSEANLSIGSAFTLLIGGIYELIISPENLVSGMVNSTKVVPYETWGGISTTWATEPRTWLDCGSLFENNAKPITSMTNESRP